MATAKFDKREAVRFGWETMKRNPGFFVLMLIIVGLIYVVPEGIRAILGAIIMTEVHAPPVGVSIVALVGAIASAIIWLGAWVVQTVMAMGLIRICLKFCDGEKAELADLFSCFRLFFRYLWASIVYVVIVLAGLILLIVPGIIWAIKYQFYSYFIVDKGARAMEALERSAAITKGVKWDLFLFALLLVGIEIVGALCLLVGLFAALPTIMVAMAFVYRKLLARLEPPQIAAAASSA